VLNIGFVVTPGFPVMSVAALSVFEFANIHAERALYRIEVLSEDGGPVPTSMAATLSTVPFGETHFDTLIIGGHTQINPTSPALLDFVQRAAGASRRVASICTGVFALADAGLLEGRRATTHWMFTQALKSRFPDVRLEENRIFVTDGAIWTAAGNSAGIDLALSMLESDYGAELALTVARTLVVERWRAGGQSQHSPILEMNPKTDRIQNALDYARRNLKARFSIDAMAQAAGLGPRQFSRAFRAETGITPAKAVEALRLDAARLMIEKGRHSVQTVAAETGFGDQERMRRAFLRAFSTTPQELRRSARRASSVNRGG
jgi:transcriptional regulator GlxA family with amidase domain